MEAHFANPFRVYDPMIKDKIMDNQELNFQKFLEESDIIVLMVEHTHLIENLDSLEGKVVLDTHNLIKSAYKL